MPAYLLLSTLTDNWEYATPFVAAGLALASGYTLSILNARRNEQVKHDADTATEQKTWRDCRLSAEKTMTDNIAAERTERIQWQLKREAESAMVAGILEESAEAQKVLASIAATTRHLESGQDRIDGELRELRNHLTSMQDRLITLATFKPKNVTT